MLNCNHSDKLSHNHGRAGKGGTMLAVEAVSERHPAH